MLTASLPLLCSSYVPGTWDDPSEVSGPSEGHTGPVIRTLRLASIAEGTSYLLLLVATVVKQTGGTSAGVSALGPIHGVLYLIFAALVLRHRRALGWDGARTIIALVVGSLPLGGFWLERTWLAPLDGDGGRLRREADRAIKSGSTSPN